MDGAKGFWGLCLEGRGEVADLLKKLGCATDLADGPLTTFWLAVADRYSYISMDRAGHDPEE